MTNSFTSCRAISAGRQLACCSPLNRAKGVLSPTTPRRALSDRRLLFLLAVPALADDQNGKRNQLMSSGDIYMGAGGGSRSTAGHDSPTTAAAKIGEEQTASTYVAFKRENSLHILTELLGFFSWTSYLTIFAASCTVIPVILLGWFLGNLWMGVAITLLLYIFPLFPPPRFLTKAVGNFFHLSRFVFAPNSRVVLDDRDEILACGSSAQKPPTVIFYHPHGIISSGLVFLQSTGCLDSLNLRYLTASFLTYSGSLLRAVISLFTRIGATTRNDVKGYLRNRENLVIVPGGFEEATITRPGSATLYFKQRKGMIKYLLQQGYSLTPSYGFGENELFSNVQGGWEWRFFLNKFGIPAVFFWGKSLLMPHMPKQVPLWVVVGRPIPLPRIENPTATEIDFWHAKYVEALSELYNKYKTQYAESCNIKKAAEPLLVI